jgi:hypothetical protein
VLLINNTQVAFRIIYSQKETVYFHLHDLRQAAAQYTHM